MGADNKQLMTLTNAVVLLIGIDKEDLAYDPLEGHI